uniref:60S ribosomal protein L35a n=1 Tax=Steinernema glaseri TaxID=37863 RepID=A0A1I7Z3T8_9BILA
MECFDKGLKKGFRVTHHRIVWARNPQRQGVLGEILKGTTPNRKSRFNSIDVKGCDYAVGQGNTLPRRAFGRTPMT